MIDNLQDFNDGLTPFNEHVEKINCGEIDINGYEGFIYLTHCIPEDL